MMGFGFGNNFLFSSHLCLIMPRMGMTEWAIARLVLPVSILHVVTSFVHI